MASVWWGGFSALFGSAPLLRPVSGFYQRRWTVAEGVASMIRQCIP